jgi:hypothetical protein
MKKLLSLIMLLSAAVVFITCERNDLYNNLKDDTLSLLGINLGAGGGLPDPPTEIYLYSTSTHPVQQQNTGGQMGDRAGADQKCVDAAPAGTFTEIHALLSVSASDQMRYLSPAAWWSGSDIYGYYYGSFTNCAGWTSDTGTGTEGISNYVDSQWIHYPSGQSCGASCYLLCVAW